MNPIGAPAPPTLQAEHWRRLSSALDELLELDDAALEARLQALRQQDPAFAAELRALLGERERMEGQRFLEGSALPPARPTLTGRPIGAYTIEREIGAGGMGSVWLARRSDGRYEGQVALKLLNLALVSHGGAERFAREGNVLARLTHPGIAHLLDAGVTEAGQPYLVLEHVQGEPIDRWCRHRGLDTTARVRLMLEVMAAVQHAHAKLVLHRDLKPDNILVTSEGRVKLLDFGIAKWIDNESQAAPASALTREAGRAFTPEYAAPEQVEGGDVTTATDVYALGVLLYVLLAGVHPTVGPADDTLQRLRSVLDTEPRRLSDAACAEGAPDLVRTLRGDLDNVCAKALKKVPAERYATVAAFADDLRRWLADEPVSARADTLPYRAAKFMRRHRLGVGAAAVTVVALVAGIVGTAWQAREAGRQRAQALVERDRAQALLGRNEAIATFIETMFTEAMPAGQAQAVQQLLERAEPLVLSLFEHEPANQAEVLRVLASYYTQFTQPAKQDALLTRARRIVESVPDASLKASLDCDHAAAAHMVGRSGEARRLLASWLDAAGIDPVVAASCLKTRAVLAQNEGDAVGAQRYAQAGLDRLRAAGVRRPRLEAGLMGDLGFAQHLAGHSVEADRSYEAALARLRALGRGDSYDALRLTLDRGVVRYALADYLGGLEMFEHVLRATQRQGGFEQVPPGVLANRANGLERLGRYDEALTGYGQALDASRRVGFAAGEAYSHVGRAGVLVALERLAEAEAAMAAARPPLEALPPTHSARLRHDRVQARLLTARGDAMGAERVLTAQLDAATARGLATAAISAALRDRAEVRLRAGRIDDALDDAAKAVELARRLQGTLPHSDTTGEALLTQAHALRAARRPWRDAAAAAHAELLATLGDAHPQVRDAVALLAGG